MIGEELAPERAQRILLCDGADLDAVARRAVIAAGGKATGSRLALSVAAGVWFGVSGDGMTHPRRWGSHPRPAGHRLPRP